MAPAIAPKKSELIIIRKISVTDHRFGLTLYNLEDVLNGDLDQLIDGAKKASYQLQLEEKSQGMKIRIILAVLLTVLLLGIARRTSMRHSLEYLTETHGITFTHETATEGFSDGAQVALKATKTDTEVAVVRFSDQPGGPYQELNMTPENGVYKVTLPAKEKGSKQYYHIEVYKNNIKIATFPTAGDQVIKFKGNVTHVVLVAHILCMFATIFFGLMAVFTSIDLARGKGDARLSILYVLLTFASAYIGGIPLGIVVFRQTFGGSGWGGWPLGTDITDTKTELLLLFWLITLFYHCRVYGVAK